MEYIVYWILSGSLLLNLSNIFTEAFRDIIYNDEYDSDYLAKKGVSKIALFIILGPFYIIMVAKVFIRQCKVLYKMDLGLIKKEDLE